MRRLLTAFVLAASATSAFAADMPSYPAETAFVSEPSWDRCYVGVHVTATTGEKRTAFPFSDNSHDIDGPTGGVQAGCDKQFKRVVVGLIGDISATDVTGDNTYISGVAITNETEVNFIATVRGRLGWGFDKTLLYVTGGAAFADLDVTLSTAVASETESNTHFGWTVGAGGEMKVTEKISLFAEYLYTDLGSETYSYGPPDSILTAQDHESDLEFHTFKIGANYSF
jgi:opacity protein-like surface antigen